MEVMSSQSSGGPMPKRLGIRHRPPYHQMRHTFATLAVSAGENIHREARRPGHQSPVVTLEKDDRFVLNLIRTKGKALLEAGNFAKHFANRDKLKAGFQ